MKIQLENQIEFSTILFDTLFGLILFFSIDSFLDIHEALPFIFYLFALLLIVHWWFIFKSADDAFGEEVTDSAADIIFGITYLILLDYSVLLAKTFNYRGAAAFIFALLAIDLVWAVVWRYVGSWQTTNHGAIKQMELELSHNIRANLVVLIPLAVLLAVGAAISPIVFCIALFAIYALYVSLTFLSHILDVKIF